MSMSKEMKAGEGYIVIDMGTTNTRIRYVEDGRILSSFKEKTGVRDTAISGSTAALSETLRRGTAACLADCGKEFDDLKGIVASGMITSNLGLLEVPHQEAPAGVKELCGGIREKLFPDIAPLPIAFIPGVKNHVEGGISDLDFEGMDMMRGEEVEAIGALRLSGGAGKLVYISPGSHTKFVFIDEKQRITSCGTTLAGELLWALSAETILADSIPDTLISEIDETYIRMGMEAEKKYGFTKTCFLTRIMDVFTGASPNARANFIAGAIAGCDMRAVGKELDDESCTVVIGGNDSLGMLYRCVLEHSGCAADRIRILSRETLEEASAAAAVEIYRGRFA